MDRPEKHFRSVRDDRLVVLRKKTLDDPRPDQHDGDAGDDENQLVAHGSEALTEAHAPAGEEKARSPQIRMFSGLQGQCEILSAKPDSMIGR